MLQEASANGVHKSADDSALMQSSISAHTHDDSPVDAKVLGPFWMYPSGDAWLGKWSVVDESCQNPKVSLCLGYCYAASLSPERYKMCMLDGGALDKSKVMTVLAKSPVFVEDTTCEERGFAPLKKALSTPDGCYGGPERGHMYFYVSNETWFWDQMDAAGGFHQETWCDPWMKKNAELCLKP